MLKKDNHYENESTTDLMPLLGVHKAFIHDRKQVLLSSTTDLMPLLGGRKIDTPLEYTAAVSVRGDVHAFFRLKEN